MKHSSLLSLAARTAIRLLPLSALLLGGWHELAATTLSAPTTVTQCTTAEPGSSLHIEDPLSCSLGGGGALSSFASLTTGPFVSLSVQAMAPGFPVNAIAASAVADLLFEYQVTGGNPGDIVPVFLATNLATTGTDGVHGVGFAFVSFGSADFLGESVAACTAGSGCGSPSPSFSGVLKTFVRSGKGGNMVNIHVQASAGSSPNSEAASAFADPFIFVDPSFLNASQYSVVLSPGVGNGLAAAAPEPATWALLLSGGLLCGVGRLKRGVSKRSIGDEHFSDS